MTRTNTHKLKSTSAQKPPEDAEYKLWVEMGKNLIEQMKSASDTVEISKMELGELADWVVEKKYGENTLLHYAQEIGTTHTTLNRCRSVWRAWHGPEAPKEATPPKLYSVAQELQAHPRRWEIIQEKPNLTVREARRITRQYKRAGMTADDDLRKNHKRWLNDVTKHAGLILSDSCAADGRITPQLHKIWREETDSETLAAWREAHEAFGKFIDRAAKILATPPGEDDFDADEPRKQPIKPRPTTQERTAPTAAA
jgi:hypothetical protein